MEDKQTRLVKALPRKSRVQRPHPSQHRPSERPPMPNPRYLSSLRDRTLKNVALAARKVLIVSKRVLVREALAALIGNQPDLVVAAHCSSLTEALGIARATHMDSVVFEVRVSEERLTEQYKEFRDLCELTHVLVLIDGVPPALTKHVVHSAAEAVLPAAVDGSTMLAAIRCISSGETWTQLNVLNAEPQENGAGLHLTDRQVTVLRLIYQGLSNKEISARLEVSNSSVKSSIQQLFKRIGVRTRSQLVREAVQCFPDLLLSREDKPDIFH
jgi:two-component system, NarL family, nitrate/nitrite response regulator NarL